MKICFAVFGLVFWGLAVLQFFCLANFFEGLPARYVAETKYSAQCHFRQTPSAQFEDFDLIVRRRDQTLTSGSGHSIIQGDMHWMTPQGTSAFEVRSLYGVDRSSRQNLPGFGNEERSGQYFFPLHVEPKSYRYWDPSYAGPRVAMFDHSEKVGEIPVYVFNFVADGIDETSGYVSLPDVPEKYRAITYGKGRLWIEPYSGLVVDYEDAGVSYFVEPATGKRVGEIFTWSDHYTPETRNAQLRLATRERRRMFALERGLPGALVLAGLVCAVCGLRRKTKLLPARAAAAQLLEIA
jgi:hypothetical protein